MRLLDAPFETEGLESRVDEAVTELARLQRSFFERLGISQLRDVAPSS